MIIIRYFSNSLAQIKLFSGLLHILQMEAGLHLSKFHSEDSYIEKKSSSVSYRSWSLFSK